MLKEPGTMAALGAFRADPGDRRNNLTLIRLIAALAVMVSHAWPIVLGPGADEPLAATGYTLGTIAVMVFFALSGFLIAASWQRAPRPGRFLARRARRLLPGLWVMLVLSALVMGPLVSRLEPGAYLADPGLWRYLVRNAALFPIEPALPGVFDDNPYPAVAGSIWTLHYEALCYLGLLAVAVSGGLTRQRVHPAAAVVLVSALAALAAAERLHPRLESLVLLGLPFALGVSAYLWRRQLVLTWAAIPAIAALTWLVRGTPLYDPAFTALVVYSALWVGFVPWTTGRAFAQGADLSYGIYLYAFPVQGLIQYLADPTDVMPHLLLAIPPTLVLAALSWYWVERPWLQRTSVERHGRMVRWRQSAASRWRASNIER